MILILCFSDMYILGAKLGVWGPEEEVPQKLNGFQNKIFLQIISFVKFRRLSNCFDIRYWILDGKNIPVHIHITFC